MLAIRNLRLIDGSGAPVKENADILIQNGAFVEVGERLRIPERASVINGAGRTAMPGLIDAHSHIGGSSSLEHPPMSTRFASYDFTEAREGSLRWGVTTLRSAGDAVPSILELRDDVAAGRVVRCPRILAAGPMFIARGGHPGYTVYMSDETVLRDACVVIDADTDIEAEVARVAAMGVDFIKTFYAHINKLAYPVPAVRLTRTQLGRIISAAHANGKPAMVHVDGALEMEAACALGADYIEHVIAAASEDTQFSDELIESLASSGAVVTPTMVSIAPFDHMPGAEPVMEKLMDAVSRMYSAGVRLAIGCDTGAPFIPYGEAVHTEMELMTKCGVPNGEAIEMATLGNARALGIDNRVGAIEPGKEADLVLLGSNPLEDIRGTRDIRLVLKRGQVMFDTSETY